VIRRRHRWTFLALGLALGLAQGPAAASPPVVGILPLANHTGQLDALDALVDRLHAELSDHGVTFVSSQELRPLLRRHRIRSVGEVGSEAAALIRAESGVDFLLLGSLQVHDEAALEAALSLRVVDARDLRVVGATSEAASGAEFEGLFGTGGITRMEPVVDRIVAAAVATLVPLLDTTTPVPSPDGPRLAMIPFDDLSDTPRAGAIVTDIVLSQLVAAGYVLVEPGLVTEVLLAERAMTRGTIDLPTLRALRDALAPDYLLTGVVDRLDIARGDPDVATPSLALGARLVDAHAGMPVAAWEFERSGTDSETILGRGSIRTLGALVRATAADLRARLDHQLADHTPDEGSSIDR